MPVYTFSSDDFHQLDSSGIIDRLAQWADVLRTVEKKRFRFILRAVPMSLDTAIYRARQAEATAPDEQALQHVRQYTSMLQSITLLGGVLSFEHYLVLPDDDLGAAEMLARGLGVQFKPVPSLPALLPTRYHVMADKLVPESESGINPFMSVLVSYELSGRWQWTTLANVLEIGFPIDIAIDIITYPGAATHGELDKAQTVMEGVTLQVGAKAALAKQAADYSALLYAVQHNEILHEVLLGFLVRGSTEAELRERERAVKNTLAGFASLHRYDGLQKDAFDTLFSAEIGRTSKLPVDLWHNVTSSGVATALGGFGVLRYGDTGGVMWGFSRQSPLFWDGFGENLTEPNHGAIFGRSGSGKTFSVNVLALREMNLLGSQVIVMEPYGHCRRLVKAVGTERSSYNPLSTQSLRINPIERLYEDDASQAEHLAIVARLLLNRALTPDEGYALDAATRFLYEGVSTDTPAVNQPRIENLVLALRSLDGEGWLVKAADKMAGQLRQQYVLGTRAPNFNVATESDWRMMSDLVAFDFSGMTEEGGLRRLCYYLVLSAIQREAFRQSRSRRRIVVVDEFKILSQEPMLAEQVANMFKTFRTTGVGVWVMEQDIQTLVGLSGIAGATVSPEDYARLKAGDSIMGNAAWTLALAHNPGSANRLRSVYPSLHAAHIRDLHTLDPKLDANKGRGFFITPDAVYPIHIQPTQYELALLGGS